MYPEWLIETAKIAPITIPLAALIAIVTLLIQKHDKKLEKAFDYVRERRSDLILREANAVIRKNILPMNRIETEYVRKLIEEGDFENELLMSVLTILNEHEGMAKSIEHGLLNEDYMYNSLSTTLIRDRYLFVYVIDVFQKGDSNTFASLVRLEEKWNKRRLRSIEKLGAS